MAGKVILCDTNIIIELLKGNSVITNELKKNWSGPYRSKFGNGSRVDVLGVKPERT